MVMTMSTRFIRWFSELGLADVPQVGGKNASLGEMVRELAPCGVRVPDGFAITAEAYRHVLEGARAGPRLHEALDGLDAQDIDDLARRAQRARNIVAGAALPDDLVAEIRAAYTRLKDEYGDTLTVAVRSSATAEDLPTASFAGQHETFLNVAGEARLLDSVRLCFGSLFKDRAIAYRAERGIDHFKVLQSVGVMKMVRSDCASSGVIFTLDTETGFRDVVFVTGAYGLGENVVQGTVDPDEFYVFKPTLARGHRQVLRRKLGSKDIRMVYAKGAGRDTTRNMPTSAEDRGRFCIADAEVLELAEAAVAIESHYSRRAGQPVPMDIEWARDGVDGKLYIVQARPETVASRKPAGMIDEYRLGTAGRVCASGRAVGGRIASGRARVVTDVAQLGEFRPGEVLVADTTMPDWGTVMKIAAAVVTNRGGRTCHAAIVARELGIPAVVGCEHATTAIGTGDEVTVSCAQGSVGRVYAGALPFTKTSTDVSAMARPRTRMMVNIGNPDTAFQTAMLPNDGVGLARMEFIVAEHIRVHPMALVHPEKVDDAAVRDQIARLALGFDKPSDFFVRQLAEGVGTIAAAFYPKPVIVRMSDFKTNEYASLLGGRWFEPAEANPMIGFRGASRYAHPAYAEGFALECAAMKRVRDDMGLGQG
jgi:pyruvate,water dikinase